MDAKIKKWNNRAQVTIFIIIALMLVVIIAMIFVARTPPRPQITDEKSPQPYIDGCAKLYIKEALQKIQTYGGSLSPGLSVMYNDFNRSYLCYTSLYFQPCVNQRPRLKEYIESQITEYIKPKLTECFLSLSDELKKRYEIQMDNIEVTTRLAPNEVLVEINKKFVMSRGGVTSKEFNSFKIQLIHPIYKISEIANEIVNQEAQFCNFDNLGYMIMYPDYEITKFETGNADIIYTIKDRNSGNDFTFAVKSCPLPPGM